jgi:hypothetical protein
MSDVPEIISKYYYELFMSIAAIAIYGLLGIWM